MAIIIIVVIVGLLYTSAITSTDVSSAVSYTLVAGIVGVLMWGFKSRIIHKIENNGVKRTQIDKHESVESKKKEPSREPT